MSSWLEASKQAGQLECAALLKDIHTIQGVAAVKQAVWQFLQVRFKGRINSIRTLSCSLAQKLWINLLNIGLLFSS